MKVVLSVVGLSIQHVYVNVSDWHRDKYSLWFDVVLKCEQGNIYEGIRCDFIKFKEWDCYEDFIWN